MPLLDVGRKVRGLKPADVVNRAAIWVIWHLGSRWN